MARYNNLKIDETLLLLKGDKGEKGDKGDGAEEALAQIETLKQIVIQNGVTSLLEVEQAFTSRETADGENIVDGQFAVVKEIKGSTVVDESTGTLKHAFISGIKSTGRNLIPYPYDCGSSGSQDGIDYTVNADGSITLNGTALNTTTIWLRYNTHPVGLEVGKIYRVNSSGIEGVYIAVQANDYSNNISDGGSVATFPEYMAYITIFSGTTINNTTFYPMLYAGAEKKSYEPYTEETYQLPQTLELGEWDSFNPQTGELVKATESVEFDGTEGWGEYIEDGVKIFTISITNVFGTYSLSFGDEITVFDKNKYAAFFITGAAGGRKYHTIILRPYEPMTLDEFKTLVNENPVYIAFQRSDTKVETIANVPKSYKAYNHGSEAVQGGTDNGAMPTVSVEYFKLTEV